MASSAAALKKKAAEFVQTKQFDKALALYRQVLDEDEGDEDVSLFNRVGDMYLRAGQIGDAMEMFERAVDRYDDQGLYNNAIALCNKILRQSPGRISVYYKLGKVAARKGFKQDAKANFLEYATRKQKEGNLNEAFRALKEFADLCPDQDDIRLMLADQLSKEGRKAEALEQLQILFERYTEEGNSAEAVATATRMKALDPSVEPSASAGTAKHRKSSELVFLDLDDLSADAPKRTPKSPAPAPTVAPPAPAAAPRAAHAPKAAPPAVKPTTSDLPLLSLSPPSSPVVPRPAPPVVPPPAEPEALPLLDIEPLAGLEAGSVLAEYGGSVGLPVERFAGDQPVADTPADAGGDFAYLDAGEPAAAGPSAPAADANPFDLPFITDEGGVTESPTDATASRATSTQPAFLDPSPAETSSLLDDAFSFDGLPHPEAPAEDPPAEARTVADEIAMFMADEPPPAAVEAPPPRRTSVSLARNVLSLRARLDREPENWDLMRTFGEALLEDGERGAGISALEAAMVGYETGDDLISARSVAEEIVRLMPNSIKHQQKRVEYCFRSGDRAGLVEAYVDLADSLLRDGQADKARSVYGRVLDLAPGEARATTALQALALPEAPPRDTASREAARDKPRDKPRDKAPARYTGSLETPLAAAVAPPPVPPVAAGGDFIDLGDLLRDDEPEKSTRMVVSEHEPTGDEDADFQDMLRRFKQGVAENVEEEDYDSHYDLGVAFKEMGLLDEAIGEFQKALRGTRHRIRTHEALGQCFIEKQMWPVAATILHKATMEPSADDAQLIGVLYLLGNAYEAQQRPTDALSAYERVYAVDIGFRDVAQRVSALGSVSR
ncbi:MAG: tetratricopeptide repeat protein [Gemmatimonadota bacterium]